jgi:hypothetical protein
MSLDVGSREGLMFISLLSVKLVASLEWCVGDIELIASIQSDWGQKTLTLA